jgi:hypothetical protein
MAIICWTLELGNAHLFARHIEINAFTRWKLGHEKVIAGTSELGRHKLKAS